MGTPINPSATIPNPAVPTRAQMIDAAVTGILATVFNSDGTTDVRLVQVDDSGKLAVGGDVSKLLVATKSTIADALTSILVEMRIQNLILAQAHGITDDLEQLRQDVQKDLA